ncbi:HNH endonuclease [Candidatus Poribacteria bacterium]|nr:HNH endonuclease [Candidatus Poribacteria bacterium]
MFLQRDSFKCIACGRAPINDGIILHVDHIIPKSKGGTDSLDNLQTLCSNCNLGKSNKDNTDIKKKLIKYDIIVK